MTLEEQSLSPGLAGVKPPSLPLDTMDYNVPTREKPMLHPAVDPILCQVRAYDMFETKGKLKFRVLYAMYTFITTM